MGIEKSITQSAFPKQGSMLGKTVSVCFHYRIDECIAGVVVRDDVEAPWRMIIRLQDGRHVLSTECHYSITAPTT